MSPRGIEKINGVPVAHIEGDIDAANATATEQQLTDALDSGSLSLVVDLSDARYVDSAGIDMLLRLSDRLDRRRAELILVIPDVSPLKRLAILVGLPEVVAIHPSLESALQKGDGTKTPAAGPSPT